MTIHKVLQNIIDECDSLMSRARHQQKHCDLDGNTYEHSHQDGRWHGINDIQEYVQRQLQSIPETDGWIPIDDNFINGYLNGKGPFLVTNNLHAVNAHGKMSHVWCDFLVHKNPKGNHGIEGLYYVLNGPYSLSHYKEIETPQKPAAPKPEGEK